MIITTNDLNNIETKITTPQIEGIEFIDAILDGDEIVAGINASYNDIIAIIENGKLPIIRIRRVQNNTLDYSFFQSIGIDNHGSYYVSVSKMNTLISGSATANLAYGNK